jgi:hypothetical protein
MIRQAIPPYHPAKANAALWAVLPGIGNSSCLQYPDSRPTAAFCLGQNDVLAACSHYRFILA